MSQADIAPITGMNFVAPGKSDIIAGLSPGFFDGKSPSRRGMLAAMLLAPAAVAFGPALAAVGSEVEFWTAKARYDAINAEWNAALGDEYDEGRQEALLDHYSPLEHRAMQAVMIAPISTIRALLAKLEVVDGTVDMDTADDEFPDFWACLLRDVKGLAA
jgi:hypothetical protein